MADFKFINTYLYIQYMYTYMCIHLYIDIVFLHRHLLKRVDFQTMVIVNIS